MCVQGVVICTNFHCILVQNTFFLVQSMLEVTFKILLMEVDNQLFLSKICIFFLKRNLYFFSIFNFFFTTKHFSYNIINCPHLDSNPGPLCEYHDL